MLKKNGLGFLSKCPWGGFVSWVRLSLGWVCLWGTFVPGVGLSLVYVCLGVCLSLGWVCPLGRFVSGVRLSRGGFVPGVGLSLGWVCPWCTFVLGWVCLGWVCPVYVRPVYVCRCTITSLDVIIPGAVGSWPTRVIEPGSLNANYAMVGFDFDGYFAI